MQAMPFPVFNHNHNYRCMHLRLSFDTKYSCGVQSNIATSPHRPASTETGICMHSLLHCIVACISYQLSTYIDYRKKTFFINGIFHGILSLTKYFLCVVGPPLDMYYISFCVYSEGFYRF